MTMTIEEQRKAIIEDANRKEFEEWFINEYKGGFPTRAVDGKSYSSISTNNLWQTWKAARNQSNNVPVAWQFFQDGKWHHGMDTNNHKQNTIDGGFPVRELYTSPQQSNALEMAAHEEAVTHLWECLGRWSAYLVTNGEQAELAPPDWLTNAIRKATQPESDGK